MTMKEIDYNECARILKAIAHPTRLQIVALIQDNRPCVKGIEAHLGLTQPNISQHLSILRNIGIVEPEREGNQVCYQLKNQLIIKLLNVLKNEKGGQPDGK